MACLFVKTKLKSDIFENSINQVKIELALIYKMVALRNNISYKWSSFKKTKGISAMCKKVRQKFIQNNIDEFLYQNFNCFYSFVFYCK